MSATQMTCKQLRQINNKCKQIETELLPKARLEFNRARSNGDMRENDEADSARNQIQTLNTMLRNLQRLRSEAVICEDTEIWDDSVSLSSRVTFRLDDMQLTKTLSNPGLDYMNTVSMNSVLGKLLKGKHIGDSFTYEDCMGCLHRVQILEVV